ncbi:MAG: hypothetical protein V3V47_07325 [Desulfobacteria bacterium]
MGTLSHYLQTEFFRQRPRGWSCPPEAAILPRDLCRLLGFTPRTDVLLARDDGLRRYWIEFEISRADPVANHAKFAATHLFNPQSKTDVSVSMVSSHVAPGRRNLGATTISLMRHVGMDAFQTVLLPRLPLEEVRRLNRLPPDELQESHLDIRSELSRVFEVSEPLSSFQGSRIHFIANVLEVILNIRSWNLELKTSPARKLWERRRKSGKESGLMQPMRATGRC